ncbi:MAG TPA: TIGR04282 family arsenosugar biosynthesis glycosyltransferase [Geminicoccaceae bacterium]
MADRDAAKPVLIFARAPRLGEVKRRLAAGIGEEGALDFYRTTLFELTARLRMAPGLAPTLVVTPDESLADASLWPPRIPRVAQGSGDLGARLRRALEGAPALPAILIGSDVPGIGTAHVERAFALLADHDLVFGPSPDGGFWLIGTRRRPLPAGFFGRVRWSSQHALEDSLNGIPGGWSVALADQLADVDDACAYAEWRGEVPA